MKKVIYILFVYLLMLSLSTAATSYNKQGALDWYGYSSHLSVESVTEDHSGDDDDKTFRKRRHRRRRKIRPPKKGW